MNEPVTNNEVQERKKAAFDAIFKGISIKDQNYIIKEIVSYAMVSRREEINRRNEECKTIEESVMGLKEDIAQIK